MSTSYPPLTLISESEARGGGVDGRIRRVRLPASTRVSPPVSGRHDGPEGAEEPPQLQELQVVHERGGLGSAQTLPAGGASCCSVGRGTVTVTDINDDPAECLFCPFLWLYCHVYVCCRFVTWAAACAWRVNTLHQGVPSAWRAVWRAGAMWAGATDRWAAKIKCQLIEIKSVNSQVVSQSKQNKRCKLQWLEIYSAQRPEEHTVTTVKLVDFSGSDIVGNIWDNITCHLLNSAVPFPNTQFHKTSRKEPIQTISG